MISNFSLFVLRVGLEPTRPCGQGILSPSCLPFHHQSSLPVPVTGGRLPAVGLVTWSGKRDSNSRPRPWQGRALPTELFPHLLLSTFQVSLCLFSTTHSFLKSGCKSTNIFSFSQTFLVKKLQPPHFQILFFASKSSLYSPKSSFPPFCSPFSTIPCRPFCSYPPNSLIFQPI